MAPGPVSESLGGASRFKKIYIPYMTDHVHVLMAALRHHGIESEVLPPPDAESLAIGLDLCRGRECLPCFLATGDVLRACRNGTMGADAAVFMPASPGPCRFGQYRILQRTLLDREGYAGVEIISPTSDNSYRGFGDNPTALRRLVWQGFVAVDLLLKLVYEFRPYELEPGVTDAAYKRALNHLAAATGAGGSRHLTRAMDEVARLFATLPVDRSARKPVIAMLGEIYVMLNAHANQDIVRLLEAAGAEVVTGSMAEWLHFSNVTKIDRDAAAGLWRDIFGTKVLMAYQHATEARLRARVHHLLRNPPDPPMRELLDNVRPYTDPLLGTETTLTLAKVAHLARHGASGVLNVMPFSCMPGIVVSGISSRVRRDFDQLPWLDLNFDGQRITNITTRLEAFVHQVTQFARSHGRLGGHQKPRDAAAAGPSER
jgi:predicted nucleotide-binding protein (sugar kinase/HSP70/actin superfamily)